MVQASDIRQHMEVLGSDGALVGVVDHLDGDTIKLAKSGFADQQHHYVPLASVVRVDKHVHLGVTAHEALGGAVRLAPGASYGAGATAAGGGGFGKFLPWIILALAIIAALLLFKGCAHQHEARTAQADTAPLPVGTVTLPNGNTVAVAPQTMNYELQRYLASAEPTPRTFTFDKLNFDSTSAVIRPADQANVQALADILGAYPTAQVRVVGYTDARGGAGANAMLGKQRADAVAAALTAKGVAADRITAGSGGESNPADTNATTQGQFENRRTELVVTGK